MRWELQILGQRDCPWLVSNKSKKVGLKSMPEVCTYGERFTTTTFDMKMRSQSKNRDAFNKFT